MRTLGKLFVIWGVLFPLIVLPSVGSGAYRFMPAFDVHFGWLHIEYGTVLETALFMVGIGLSLWALVLMPVPGGSGRCRFRRGRRHCGPRSSGQGMLDPLI
jgi:hypothetical protein